MNINNMETIDFEKKAKDLIDKLKAICSSGGLGNSAEEFKVIIQVFLYKFINDKFGYDIKQIDKDLATKPNWEEVLLKYPESKYETLLLKLGADTAKLKREHFISYLHKRQNDEEFAKLFDDTLREVSILNSDIFSVKTNDATRVQLFEGIESSTRDISDRDGFFRAVINAISTFSFDKIFEQKFDFFSTIFEYLIKDYNSDGGGVYAEYYTPHSIAKVMANILVDKNVKNVTVYDPSAGSGTLLMNIAHKIGEDKCTIYSQDISRKSSALLRLNLILNNLVHSIHNIIQGNTILEPFHKDGQKLKKFDYVVSNPPFKTDFSDYRDRLDTPDNKERFFAGVPKIKAKDKKKMEIYLLFIQHIMFSLSTKGKAAIVVPTGFITAQSGIEKKIREKLIDEKMLKGVISMPSNIFATTGTNVSVIFIDKENKDGKVMLMDASKLGTTVKEGKNQKTVLSQEEEFLIIDTFNKQKVIEDLSVAVNYDEIKKNNYSFSAGQHFEVKIEYTDITTEEFKGKVKTFENQLNLYFSESKDLEVEIIKSLKKIFYD